MSKATVFIGDLSRFCSDEDISSLFHRFGKVLETKIMRNPVTGISLGYGFLIMSSTESAFLAMQYLHGVQLRGRPLRVKWAGRNIKSDASSASVPRFPRDSPAETVINSVHVRFQALHVSCPSELMQFFSLSFLQRIPST
jgi:RNA recognition motif-containing protein